MQTPSLNHAPERSRSQSKVTSLSFEFCTPSISLLPLEGNAWSNVHLWETVFKAPDKTVQTQGSVTVEFHVPSVSPLPLEGFSVYSRNSMARTPLGP